MKASITTWAAPADIFKTGHELVGKADLPDVRPEDLDIRVENKILTIRGDRKFEKKVDQKNYLRVERTYGSFSRSFSQTNTVNSEAIKADYKNGADSDHSEARGIKTEADQGERGNAGGRRGIRRQVIRKLTCWAAAVR